MNAIEKLAFDKFVIDVSKILPDVADMPPLCKNCEQLAFEHVEGHCLFNSTSYEPMDISYDEWIQSQLIGW